MTWEIGERTFQFDEPGAFVYDSFRLVIEENNWSNYTSIQRFALFGSEVKASFRAPIQKFPINFNYKLLVVVPGLGNTLFFKIKNILQHIFSCVAVTFRA